MKTLNEQINRMLELSGTPTSNPTVWYRGTEAGKQYNGNTADQEGPGIYFTSSEDEALGYAGEGGTVRKVTFQGKLIPVKKYARLASELEALIRMKEDWEEDAYNWSENPEIGLKKAVRDFIQYNDTPKDCFQQVWIDFYRQEELDFVQNMCNFYDGFIVDKNYQGIKHLIVYNATKLQDMEVEQPLTENATATPEQCFKQFQRILGLNQVGELGYFSTDGRVSLSMRPKFDDLSMIGVTLELIKVRPEYRNKGLASQKLEQIANAADQTGLTVYLKAIPQDKATFTPELQKLYTRFGFQPAGGNLMVRQPEMVA